MTNPSIQNVAGYQQMIDQLTSNTSGAVAAHVAQSDPHSQYQKETERNAPSGYAGLTTNGSLMVPKGQGAGIFVDSTGTPTFGWKDLLGDVKPDPGAAAPVSTNWNGNIVQTRFSVGDGVTNNFHIPHDYVPNTDIHLHAHWSVASSAINGGTVRWDFEWTYAKGHNQAQFPAPMTKSLTGTASTQKWTHQLHETQITATVGSTSALDRSLLEPDGVLTVRTVLGANSLAVTSGSTPPPFLHYVDIHYQSNGCPTKQKAPDFYT